MNTLHRYLLRHNLLYIFLSLGVSIGIYLLIDVFDRLDEFIESGLGLKTMAFYFVVKTPFIVSQVLPAVFLISILIQLGLMRRNREMTALESSGIHLLKLGTFFLLYALIWCGVQLLFSQALGVWGEEKSRLIWKEQVRHKEIEKRVLKDVWFKEGLNMVYMERVRPYLSEGEGITVYAMTPDYDGIAQVIKASAFKAQEGVWLLSEVQEFIPERFLTRNHERMLLRLELDPQSFLAVDPKTNPETLPIWQLRGVIDRLQESGSNVERLLTAYHMKWAYALSLLVMVCIALALYSLIGNIYLSITGGLVLIFVYYGLFMMGGTLGENGFLPPWLGAWFGNLVLGTLAAVRLFWVFRPNAGSTKMAVAP